MRISFQSPSFLRPPVSILKDFELSGKNILQSIPDFKLLHDGTEAVLKQSVIMIILGHGNVADE